MSDLLKVFEYAKQIGMEPLMLMDKLREWKLPVKSHMASLNAEMIDEIESRFHKEASTNKKTKTKKVAKKRKAVAKKKKTTTQKKTVVKKSITKKTMAATPPKKVTPKKTVIRRRAAVSPLIAVAPQPAPPTQLEESRAASQQVPLPTSDKSLTSSSSLTEASPMAIAADTPAANSAPTVSVSTPAKAEPTKTKSRQNIVGRMDLKRVSSPHASSQGTPSQGGGSPRLQKTVHRNIRTGFVAMPVNMPSFVEEPKERPHRKKVEPGANREQVVQTFTATEFRKREVIFQPKKKRIGLTKDNKKTQITTPKASKRIIYIHNSITVSDLAQRMGLKTSVLIKKLISEGLVVKVNSELDFDTASLITPDFGFEVKNLHSDIDEKIQKVVFGDIHAEPVPRPPVVTVMGHVDHGKTTLLDAIRNANVVSSEAGGITQHIGAYRVTLADGKVATFIDTPGHSAFTEMRARGAHITDIVIIVVAADDGVMPQTEEAINHAKAANVPIIVAINKIDSPSANVGKIKQQLMEFELVPEEWGGTTLFAEVSGLQKKGIDNLIEQIHLLAEMQEIKANPNRSATGTVIESSIKKGRGHVATLLVQEGTLKIGDCVVAGCAVGRIRHMNDEKGQAFKQAEPGMPVEVSGLEGTPQAGDRFDVCQEERQACEIATQRQAEKQTTDIPKAKVSLEEFFSKVSSGSVQTLTLILKSDVMGSNEAIKSMLAKIVHDEVKVNVIHVAVGGISESDVLLASTSNGIVIGFNVRPDSTAQQVAREEGVEIKTYSVIYELIDDVKKALSGMLHPGVVESSLGHAEVREIFNIPKLGVIAGCSVTDGKIVKGSKLRLVRDGRVVHEGTLGSLRRFKNDVKEIASGYECGIGIATYNDIKVGDVIEVYTHQEVARALE